MGYVQFIYSKEIIGERKKAAKKERENTATISA